MKLVLILLVAAAVSRANPVSADLTWPPWVMVAENVFVGATIRGAVVSGRYEFRLSPDASKSYGKGPYPLRIYLPVPIPSELKDPTLIHQTVRPRLRFRGTEFLPESEVGFWANTHAPTGARLAAFFFSLDGKSVSDGTVVSLEIQYDQPLLNIGGCQTITYVPFLPFYERYEKTMRLHRSAFLISFEAFDGTALRLTSSASEVTQERDTLISVRPRHLEIIQIQIRPKK